MLNAPSYWPADALPATLRQLSALREVFTGAYITRHYVYALDRNEPINPWGVLGGLPERDQRVESAVLAELQRLASDAPTDCAVIQQWLVHAGSAVHMRYGLTQWRVAKDHAPVCLMPSDSTSLRRMARAFEWLALQTHTGERGLLYGYLAVLNDLPSADRAFVVDGLTSGGQACQERGPHPGWLAQLCEPPGAAAGTAMPYRRAPRQR